MSYNQDGAGRKAAIDQLKFKKRSQQESGQTSTSTLSSASSWNMPPQPPFNPPPPQSRDATTSLTSRYFPPTPGRDGRILVPSSSPLLAPSAHPPHQSTFDQHGGDVVPGLPHSNPWAHSNGQFAVDPLSASSGFISGGSSAHASFTRPWDNFNRGSSGVEETRSGEPSRKRTIRDGSPPDPIDLFNVPGSPEILRPGQRRRLNVSNLPSSASSDESFSEAKEGMAGPSRPRIVRGHQVAHPATPGTIASRSDAEEKQFTAFRMTHPFHPTDVVRAAWEQAGGENSRAEQLLDDPNWKPPQSKPPAETGRVKELEEAAKAEKARVRELGKKSMLHQSRIASSDKLSSQISTPPPSKVVVGGSSPLTPPSPEVVQPRVKRLKRKVVDSDSEPEYVESEEDRGRTQRDDGASEAQALEYFNTAGPEALQELTGCTLEQAQKIVELRPFPSVDDLNAKLGQGRKKAGPAGLSPRIFEECVITMQGYGKVDDLLEDCERIGADLRAEIATWTGGVSGKGKGKEGSTSGDLPDISDDGALNLSSQAALAVRKPKYYISSQPSGLEKGVQLKDYQLLGVNWLNLLYQKKVSCILADEMGLGKTVQVISFIAHLKAQGRKGPHLIIVPSSTLENWMREFKVFASKIVVSSYYAGKDKRAQLREELLATQSSKVDKGWEVLLTTYNLAQGDEQDRKFFRRMRWETCIFDEGHVLKNFQSQRYQALVRYEARWRLLLTGTPLQNNLQELVSLMNFILPHQFSEDMESLRAVFKTKGDSKVTLLAQQRVSRAKKMMTPFVLRRRKDQVLQDLPKKTERIEWCDMTPLQKSIYNDALQRSRKTVFDAETEGTESTDAPSANGRAKSAKKTRATARAKDKLYLENSSNVLMDLRKASCHPMLFRRRFTDEMLNSITKLLLKEPDFKKRGAIFQYVKEDMEVMTDAELQMFVATYKSTRKFLQEDDCYLQAGKVQVLLKLLRDYQADDRRVLIFSQFTQVLDILQLVLKHEKIKFLVLTGSTPVDVRQALVDEFTTDESISVFLLSTRAGGMGINLTAASVVIMFDQDFNPHNDKQAQDRAYRIGQKRDVEVVKLITKGSIEEDMYQLGMTKLALDEAVAGEEAPEEVEREMKTSLMNVVRKKLQEAKGATTDGTDGKMDIDAS